MKISIDFDFMCYIANWVKEDTLVRNCEIRIEKTKCYGPILQLA